MFWKLLFAMAVINHEEKEPLWNLAVLGNIKRDERERETDRQTDRQTEREFTNHIELCPN
jgi:hypothetical protein